MDLVNALQCSAESDDVLTVLRKAMRVASKLKVNDIDEWLKNEMEGYKGKAAVPAYRMIHGTPVAYTQVPLRVSFTHAASGQFDIPLEPRPFPVHDSIPALMELKQGDGDFVYPIHEPKVIAGLQQWVTPEHREHMRYFLKFNRHAYSAIPDAVKTEVLKWALALEEKGILGEGVTFSPAEIQSAQSVTFNIHHSTIDQLNNMGSNQKG